MRPSQVLRSSELPIGKYSHYLNKDTWGHLGCILPQRGIITYTLSANRQNPLAGAANAAVFNTWRRFSKQVLYWAPPLAVAYYAMEWANHRNEYLNSKAGRAEASD
ncbi:cytochrome b-c1 complex subunit 8 [Hypomontagnella submonticulosa]|nr:cytochrome b-c1 complex subunit 8 [Hypomontagnella submonticulosa]